MILRALAIAGVGIVGIPLVMLTLVGIIEMAVWAWHLNPVFGSIWAMFTVVVGAMTYAWWRFMVLPMMRDPAGESEGTRRKFWTAAAILLGSVAAFACFLWYELATATDL